jgi:hypothetical protein
MAFTNNKNGFVDMKKLNDYTSNNFTSGLNNIHTNHPLIPNSQEYIYYKKFISIHSEDRDMLKYPNSNQFEIDMPEDILNVVSLRLSDWTFPANYNTFSLLASNITMTFRINQPYNPGANGYSNLLQEKIFEALYYYNINSLEPGYRIIIEEGFYNPQQMVIELMNKFNRSVSQKIYIYLDGVVSGSIIPPVDPSTPIDINQYILARDQFRTQGGYNNFIIVYNNVSQKIWFGNICDGFILTNEEQVLTEGDNDSLCDIKSTVPDFSTWGLPSYLGLSRCNIESVNEQTITNVNNFDNTTLGEIVPRFYYGDVFPGDNGYWLLPNPELIGSKVYWIEGTYKINLMGPAYFYMELDKQNCIDETAPFNVSPFTLQTNMTNGTVNSAFAKIAVPTTPISQWFDRDSSPYKFYYPPAERIRKLKIKLRYHNGQLVNFGLFNYTFTIEFTTMLPQILRDSNTRLYPATIL